MQTLQSRPAPLAQRLPRWCAHLLPALALAGSVALAVAMYAATDEAAAPPKAGAAASTHEPQGTPAGRLAALDQTPTPLHTVNR
jgi:hypothetical protein